MKNPLFLTCFVMACSRLLVAVVVCAVVVWCIGSALFLSLLFRQAVKGNERTTATLTLSVALDTI